MAFKYNKKLDGMTIYKIKEPEGLIFWSLTKPMGKEKLIKTKKMSEKLFNSMELSDTDQEFILKELKQG